MIMFSIYEVWTLKNSNLTGLPPIRRSSVLSAWPSCRQACACHHRALPYSDRVEPRRAGHVRHLLPLSPPCKPPREAIPLSFRLTYLLPLLCAQRRRHREPPSSVTAWAASSQHQVHHLCPPRAALRLKPTVATKSPRNARDAVR
jgi:hypothetical protein